MARGFCVFSKERGKEREEKTSKKRGPQAGLVSKLSKRGRKKFLAPTLLSPSSLPRPFSFFSRRHLSSFPLKRKREERSLSLSLSLRTFSSFFTSRARVLPEKRQKLFLFSSSGGPIFGSGGAPFSSSRNAGKWGLIWKQEAVEAARAETTQNK